MSIQFPYHYSNVRKSKKKEKPTRKTGDEGRSVAEAAANEPLGDHFPKVGSYAFLTEKRERLTVGSLKVPRHTISVILA